MPQEVQEENLSDVHNAQIDHQIVEESTEVTPPAPTGERPPRTSEQQLALYVIVGLVLILVYLFLHKRKIHE